MKARRGHSLSCGEDGDWKMEARVGTEGQCEMAMNKNTV